jgi:hypothetical protein
MDLFFIVTFGTQRRFILHHQLACHYQIAFLDETRLGDECKAWNAEDIYTQQLETNKDCFLICYKFSRFSCNMRDYRINAKPRRHQTIILESPKQVSCQHPMSFRSFRVLKDK